jgi:hypothetical protein
VSGPRSRLALGFGCSIAMAGLLVACGFGPGGERGTAEISVTRDFGRIVMYDQAPSVRESDDVMRLLTRSVGQVETSYGGGFVESIDGFEAGRTDGVPVDWFFYVDGIESPVGALEAQVDPGDSIWWDRRDWSVTMHVPAVVGSWPQPFEGHGDAVEVECLMEDAAGCDGVVRDLQQAGARTTTAGSGGETASLRVLVGPWARLRGEPVVRAITRGPAASGVYARFVASADGGWLLQPLDSRGDEAGSPYPGGLVAALSDRPDRVTWVLTGVNEETVPARLVGPDFEHRYAVVYPKGQRSRPVEIPRP